MRLPMNNDTWKKRVDLLRHLLVSRYAADDKISEWSRCFYILINVCLRSVLVSHLIKVAYMSELRLNSIQLNSTGNLIASSVQFSSVESLDMYLIYDELRRPPTARDWQQSSLNMFRIYRQSWPSWVNSSQSARSRSQWRHGLCVGCWTVGEQLHSLLQ
jgi:hypothetical protein